jgi:hypothetical protein
VRVTRAKKRIPRALGAQQRHASNTTTHLAEPLPQKSKPDLAPYQKAQQGYENDAGSSERLNRWENEGGSTVPPTYVRFRTAP